MTYLERLRTGLSELLAEDPRVILLGEDICDPYGGAFKVTRGLSTRFPDRVVSTPISEAAIVGMAGGLALRGYRPIVEVMFGDFMTLCADPIVNYIAKFRAMYGGHASAPVVVRTPMGGGRGYGPTHSQSLEKMFFGLPGLDVVCPSRFHDPGAMLKACVASDRPTLFLEHKRLYPTTCLAGTGLIRAPKDHDRLFVTRPANDPMAAVCVDNFDPTALPEVVLITYGGISVDLDTLLSDLRRDEIAVRAILVADLARPLDAFVLERVHPTICGIVIVEEGTAGFGWGAEVLASLHEALGPALPRVERLSAAASVIPAARNLEAEVLPSATRIAAVVTDLVARSIAKRRTAC